ncbi:hypothetical protein IAE22_34950, partial [Bacillus sp. S34]|nr:hypothetical protein [Bacillus sp. S34]
PMDSERKRAMFDLLVRMGYKEIEVYPYNGHEGGGFRHWERQVAFLRARG